MVSAVVSRGVRVDLQRRVASASNDSLPRRHARLQSHAEPLRVQQLASENANFMNGSAISMPVPLALLALLVIVARLRG
jgi:hypothetical protein